MPDIDPGLDEIWSAFLYLDPYRESGMGLSMIPLRAQIDYMDIFGADDRKLFCILLRALDDSYVSAYHTDQVYVPSHDQVDDEILAKQIKIVLGAG